MAVLGELISRESKQEEDLLPALMAVGDLPSKPAPEVRGPASEAVANLVANRVTSLTIVIPAKNESLGLPALLAEVRSVLAVLPNLQYETIVVDDGSRDGTAKIAADAGSRVIRHPESLGNGAAVKRGIREARMEWILLLDGDGQHPPEAIPSLVAAADGFDMVVGSRGGAGGSAHRNLANKIYNAFASYVANRPIPDLTSGFRLVRADLAKGFAYLLPNTFSYPSTLTLSLLRAGYSVGFEPISVRPRQGKSHIRLIQDGCRFLLIILRIATFFAPLRVFMPLALSMAGLGIAWYAVTYFTGHRFTNMAGLLLTQATVIFVLGLISEQIAAMRFERGEGQK